MNSRSKILTLKHSVGELQAVSLDNRAAVRIKERSVTAMAGRGDEQQHTYSQQLQCERRELLWFQN